MIGGLQVQRARWRQMPGCREGQSPPAATIGELVRPPGAVCQSRASVAGCYTPLAAGQYPATLGRQEPPKRARRVTVPPGLGGPGSGAALTLACARCWQRPRVTCVTIEQSHTPSQ